MISKNMPALLLGLALGLILFAGSCLFIVPQGAHAILLRLGKMVEQNRSSHHVLVYDAGLHFKLPFIENVLTFDTRLQTLDIKSSRIVTKEKKDVIVDYFVKWRIRDLGQYFISTGGLSYKAETLLEQQLNTSLRAVFGRRHIAELVSGEREDVMGILKQRAEQQAQDLGIQVVDVRIKGIELPANTSNAIYQRMRADMQKIANRHRADGQASAEAIRAGADAKVTVVLAEAKSQGQQVRSAGQSEAAAIYTQAYEKNPAFFSFYRSLKAYRNSLKDPSSLLILDQNSAFFEYLRHPLVTNQKAS